MKVFYYKRYVPSDFHIHAFSSSLVCYVPAKNIILFRERTGSFGAEDISVTTEDRMLEEARIVAKESSGELDARIKITNVRAVEVEDKAMSQLIEIAKTERDLRDRVLDMSKNLLPPIE